MNKSINVVFRITSEQDKMIRKYSKKGKLTRSEFMRSVITDHFTDVINAEKIRKEEQK